MKKISILLLSMLFVQMILAQEDTATREVPDVKVKKEVNKDEVVETKKKDDQSEILQAIPEAERKLAEEYLETLTDEQKQKALEDMKENEKAQPKVEKAKKQKAKKQNKKFARRLMKKLRGIKGMQDLRNMAKKLKRKWEAMPKEKRQKIVNDVVSKARKIYRKFKKYDTKIKINKKNGGMSFEVEFTKKDKKNKHHKHAKNKKHAHKYKYKKRQKHVHKHNKDKKHQKNAHKRDAKHGKHAHKHNKQIKNMTIQELKAHLKPWIQKIAGKKRGHGHHKNHDSQCCEQSNGRGHGSHGYHEGNGRGHGSRGYHKGNGRGHGSCGYHKGHGRGHGSRGYHKGHGSRGYHKGHGSRGYHEGHGRGHGSRGYHEGHGRGHGSRGYHEGHGSRGYHEGHGRGHGSRGYHEGHGRGHGYHKGNRRGHGSRGYHHRKNKKNKKAFRFSRKSKNRDFNREIEEIIMDGVAPATTEEVEVEIETERRPFYERLDRDIMKDLAEMQSRLERLEDEVGK